MNRGRRRSFGVEKKNKTAAMGTSKAGKNVPTMSMSMAEATVLIPPEGSVGVVVVWLADIFSKCCASPTSHGTAGHLIPFCGTGALRSLMKRKRESLAEKRPELVPLTVLGWLSSCDLSRSAMVVHPLVIVAKTKSDTTDLLQQSSTERTHSLLKTHTSWYVSDICAALP